MSTRTLPDGVVDAGRIDANLAALAGIVDPAQPGWTRLAMTEVERAGREWVRQTMQGLGLDPRIDAAGNVIGRLPGARGGRAIVVGSHTDTVAGGGRFDGTAGVVAALETVRVFRDAHVQLDHDLVVVGFYNEEPNRFGLSCVGSRALTGRLPPGVLDRCDDAGQRFGDAIRGAGIDPAGLGRARMDWSRVTAFLELHIEQGPPPRRAGQPDRPGRDHHRDRPVPGPVHRPPRPRRHHADGPAARRRLCRRGHRPRRRADQRRRPRRHGHHRPGHVHPDAANVVTERAEMLGELRSPDGEWLQHATERLTSAAAAHAASRGVGVDVEWLPLQPPTRLSTRLIDQCAETVDRLGLRRSRLFSGAEHDAAVVAAVAPTAMLFVPSHGGRSHCPEEWTDTADLVTGTTALAHTIRAIDHAAGSDSDVPAGAA